MLRATGSRPVEWCEFQRWPIAERDGQSLRQVHREANPEAVAGVSDRRGCVD